MSRRLIAAIVAVILLGSACGDDDGPTTSEPDGPTAEVLDEDQVAPTPTTAVIVEPTVDPTVAADPDDPGTVTGEQTYVVQAGDLLSVIAERFGVTVDAILEANAIADPDLIIVGQELVIPASG